MAATSTVFSTSGTDNDGGAWPGAGRPRRVVPVRLAGTTVLLLAALYVALLVLLWTGSGLGDDGWDRTTIQENDPAWDCRTMGNRFCSEGAR